MEGLWGYWDFFLPDFSADMFAVAGAGSLKLESGPPGRCRSLGPGWRSRQQRRRRRRRRDGEMKTVSEGGGAGRRRVAEGAWQGGELKGTEAREGESFRSRPLQHTLVVALLLDHLFPPLTLAFKPPV